jgi:hypothetical protein
MQRDVQRLERLCGETAVRLRGLCSHMSDDEFERFVLEVALKTLCFDLGLGPRAEAELRARFERTLEYGDPIRVPSEVMMERRASRDPQARYPGYTDHHSERSDGSASQEPPAPLT